MDSVTTQSTRAQSLHKKRSFPWRIYSECDQIRSFLRIWTHLLKKSLMENFILFAVKIPDSKNEANYSQYKFPCTSSITKCWKELEKLISFLKSFYPSASKGLHLHSNPSQNFSLIWFFNGLVMATVKGSIDC